MDGPGLKKTDQARPMGQKSWPSLPVFLVAGLVGWTTRAAIMSIIMCSDLGPPPNTHHSKRNVPTTRQVMGFRVP